MATPARPLRSYDLVAGLYDLGAHLYSGGAIAASKRALPGRLEPGQRALFLGVGTGADAVCACERGAIVTAVDRSPRMLRRLHARLGRRGLEAELICGDALAHDRPASYDAVAAHYFLNLFPPEAMRAALRRAASLVRPGGLLAIADLAPPRGGGGNRALNHLYSKPAMAAFRALRLCAWHPNYDYAAECRALGLTVEAVLPHRIARRGPALFETTLVRCEPADAANVCGGTR